MVAVHSVFLLSSMFAGSHPLRLGSCGSGFAVFFSLLLLMIAVFVVCLVVVSSVASSRRRLFVGASVAMR